MMRLDDLKVVGIGGKYYALRGWNGEAFYDCFEVEYLPELNRCISSENQNTYAISVLATGEDEDGNATGIYYEIDSEREAN